MTRIIGLDFGSKRVGIAISDGLGITASPLEVVELAVAVDRVTAIAREHEADLVVIGMPTGLGGNEGTLAGGIRELGECLIGAGLDVRYHDERFTSRIAESALLESGMKRRERRATVDKVAAAIILQSYLDSQARGNSDTG